jgi:hypothetical protein
MNEKGKITKARKVWVAAVADVAEDCFENVFSLFLPSGNYISICIILKRC